MIWSVQCRPIQEKQAKANQGFDISCFAVDWEHQSVTCPQGHKSQSWRYRQDTENPVIEVSFNKHDCAACITRDSCTSAKNAPRMLKLKEQEQYQALQSSRRRQATDEFKQHYRQRAGIEGTLSQATRCFQLRRSRYIGGAKTHLQHVLTACAMNFSRLWAYFNAIPKGKTRCSHFAALATLA